MSYRRKRFIQLCVRSTTQRLARQPGTRSLVQVSSPMGLMYEDLGQLFQQRVSAEIFIQGDVDAIGEFISIDLVNHDPLWPDVTDFESFKQWAMMMVADATSDLEITIDDLIAEGDKVVGRWTTSFTDPTTGTHVKVTGVDIIRIADGKVVEWWWSKDYLGLLQKLGVIPTPGQKE